MAMMENCLLYSVSVLLFFLKRQCVREKIRCIFHYFWNCLNPFLSSLQSTEKQTKKKTSFFVFVQPLCCFTFFFQKKHFSHFLHFHRCCLCSLFPFIFLFISFCCSPLFLFSLFSFPSFFSISVFLFLLFLQSHVSLSFFPSPFCVSSFGLTHFTSLFCSWSHSSFLPYFFFVSVSFLSCQTKYKNFSFFFRRSFFWTIPFSVFNLVFFLIASSLFLVCSMFWGFLSGSWYYFSWFSFYLSSFRVSSKNCRCFWTQLSKNIIDSC